MGSWWKAWKNDPIAAQALLGMAPDERDELRAPAVEKKPTTPEEREDLIAEAIAAARSRRDAAARVRGDTPTTTEERDELMAGMRESHEEARHGMSETQGTKACPWCGETIMAVAKKCKHCGEYLDADASVGEAAPPAENR
jgi:hypothetical protein